MAETDLPFIKQLASSDRRLRTDALTSVERFLASKTGGVSPADALKLWTGLFYALWMADRPLAQQHLCDSLADLLLVLPASPAFGDKASSSEAAWLRAFWATLAREWARIDVYRLEKFMLLVRRVLGVSLLWMRGQGGSARVRRGAGSAPGHDDEDEVEVGQAWDAERVDTVLDLLGQWPLAVGEEPDLSTFDDGDGGGGLLPKIIPVGLKLHVLDIWVDEAEKAGLVDADMRRDTEQYRILERLNGLVDKLATETTSTAVRIRSKDALADSRLPWNSEGGPAVDGDDWEGFGD